MLMVGLHCTYRLVEENPRYTINQLFDRVKLLATHVNYPLENIKKLPIETSYENVTKTLLTDITVKSRKYSLHVNKIYKSPFYLIIRNCKFQFVNATLLQLPTLRLFYHKKHNGTWTFQYEKKMENLFCDFRL